MLFSERKTAELRISEATTNSQKSVNLLFIFNAIIKYAENNTRKILISEEAIDINEVLDYYKKSFRGNKKAAFLSEYLKAYYKHRKDMFQIDLQKSDFVSKHCISNDKKYKFEFEEVSNLF